MQPTMVVAAIIRRGGRILICRRRAGDAHPLKWEFPGGKIENGETPPRALARELREELAIHARIGPEIERYQFTYPGKNPILLIFHTVEDFAGDPQNRVFQEIRWAHPADLPDFDFLEGDVDFLKRLLA
ncbi:MAG TPA: (deoxy)nucleoside triphosphate pyrophosphohydrolase [Bryobacteraceae bacterium]|nr:(deoxy)nucleoside triphosphate pyrophosphohydrolase [Bryobacteraceae bacterium]